MGDGENTHLMFSLYAARDIYVKLPWNYAWEPKPKREKDRNNN